MSNGDSPVSFVTRFPRRFWLIVILAALEGVAAVSFAFATLIGRMSPDDFTVYAHFTVIQAALIFIFAFLPLLTGPLADTIGYRKQLLYAMPMVLVGGLIYSLSPVLAGMVLGFIIMGMGRALILPVLLGSVGRLTPAQDRNYAFAIYAWATLALTMILALMLAPMVVFLSPAVGAGSGAALIILNVLICYTLLGEKTFTVTGESLADNLNDLVRAAIHPPILILLLLLGGFWFLFGATANVGLFHILYGDSLMYFILPSIFLVIFLVTGFIWAWLMDGADPFKVMMTGGALLLTGIVLSGFILHIGTYALGVFLETLGSFFIIAAAYSVVTQMATPRKMATFAALMTIPIVLGGFVGSWVHSAGTVLVVLSPETFPVYMGGMAAFGALMLALLILYYRSFGRNLYREIQETNWGREALLATSGYAPAAHPPGTGEPPASTAPPGIPPHRKLVEHPLWDDRRTPIVCVILVPILIAGSFAVGVDDALGLDDQVERIPEGPEFVTMESTFTTNNTLQEYTEDHMEHYPGMPVVSAIHVALSWDSDESSSFLGGQNEPDAMELEIMSPDGQIFIAPMTTSGMIGEAFYPAEPEEEYGHLGEWPIIVRCGDCGDDHSRFGIRSVPDDSATYELAVVFSYEGEE
jgi:MFS family permease